MDLTFSRRTAGSDDHLAAPTQSTGRLCREDQVVEQFVGLAPVRNPAQELDGDRGAHGRLPLFDQ